MVLPAPHLDNRRQEELFRELRGLIPRYTSDWTDWNESDPGIALLQLFAWTADQTLFRLNQVPDRLYVKFLELLGLSLRPPTPASTQLTFSLIEDPPSSVLIPSGTRVTAEQSGDEAPPIFETDRAIEALGAPLRAVRSFDGVRYDDHTEINSTADLAGPGYPPFGPVLRNKSALFLGFETTPAIGDQQLSMFVAVAGQSGEPLAVTCGHDDFAPPAKIDWEGWNGSRWEAIGLDEDQTRAFTRNGYIRLSLRGARLVPVTLHNDTTPYRWIRALLVDSGYQRAPRLASVCPNSVSATAARTVYGEIVGASTGLISQTLQVASVPIVPGTPTLTVDEGAGPVEWQQVDDFYGVGPDAEVYTLDETTGTITFGTGDNGRPPVANADNPTANIVVTRYRTGGGVSGNMPIGTVNVLTTPIDGVEGVVNKVAATGGRAVETVDEAKLRAPAELAAAGRAITAEDFEFFATTTPGGGIKRSIARPLTHPQFPGIEVPGSVTVVVIPDVPGPAPEPTEPTLRAVCRYLDDHRLLTSEVHVTGPRYRDVRVEVAVIVDPSADLGAVRGSVDSRIDEWFHPLTGGEAGQGWPLGGTIFSSLLTRTVLEAHTGVRRVGELSIILDGNESGDCVDVDIEPNELLRSDGHDVRVSYA